MTAAQRAGYRYAAILVHAPGWGGIGCASLVMTGTAESRSMKTDADMLVALLNPVRSPLHSRIRQALREGILDGHYAPLAQLPSESEIGAQFKASRITVRQALAELQREGLIYTLQGKGSFVAQRKAYQDVTTLAGFGESMAPLGYEVLNRLLSLRFVPADATVAQRLQLVPGHVVAEIQRVRLLDRTPVSFETTWLPQALGRQVAQADLATRDIFLILENECGIALRHADLAVDAALADAALADALHVTVGSPLLRIDRLTHDADGRPIDYEHLYFRSDTFQYRLRVDRMRTDAPLKDA